MSSISKQRALAVALAVSLVLHALLAVVLHRLDRADASRADEQFLLTDVDVAPEAPEAHDPDEDESAAATLEEVEPEDDEAVEPEPEPSATIEPIDEPIVELTADAGVADATEIAELEVDAGVVDGAMVAASEDAGGDATMLASGGDGGAVDATYLAAGGDGGIDAGGELVALAGDGGPGDGGVVAMAGDGGVGGRDLLATAADDGGLGGDNNAIAAAAPGDGGISHNGEPGAPGLVDGLPPGGPPPPAGADANLLTYLPAGEVITVLMRLDRFRGTPWAPLMEAIVRPMPDYRALVGSRQISMSDLFDTMVISSPRPQDVVATTLVARYRQSPSGLRRFLNHRESPVRWSAVRGGALGRRRASKSIPRHDQRVFLMPYPGTVLLVQPSYIARLMSKRRIAVGKARLVEADSPEWLRRLRDIERESGQDQGPALLLTLAGLPRRFEVPMVGVFPGPERVTLAFELTKGGFLVRGNLLFDSDKRAAEFVKLATARQKSLLSGYKGRLMLAPFHAVNAVKGLSLKRKGKKVAYATSISVSDGQAMLEFGAKWSQAYFSGAAGSKPAAPAPPAPPK